MAKGKYVVKFHNDMNRYKLSELSEREMDIFMSICAYVKNKGTRKVIMTLDKIREMSKYSDRDNTRLRADMRDMFKKLMGIIYEYRDEKKEMMYHLFQGWEYDEDKRCYEIQVTEKFEYLLNFLNVTFTRFELDEFNAVSGKHAKHMYRFLKQFRTTGLWRISVDDFRESMNVPKAYKQIVDIDREVINPAIEELKNFFKDLKVEKTDKKGRGRGGRVITGYRFTFGKQAAESDEHHTSDADTIKELRLKIADTELKISSTAKAMGKADEKGDYKKYEDHKKKNVYFREKLEYLKENLDAFTVDGEQGTVQPSPNAQQAADELPGQLRMTESHGDVPDETGTRNAVPMPDEIRQKYGVGAFNSSD